ncbi:PAS domain S-box-containing protein/diguanylate cyclase (GGDEF)-like protein [Vogesella indigofera]|uniref:PAS domain S-box-containing protein/diguanylate cyclase (GGDEF)-like protein n=2 Tax=Vogesella indigofera TaxID=45465 RepID=A0A495BIG3_VOGIN|nr:PAS domain S-box-containing protein/diguanylate cyclase (GGDEF)-like protein [Vogesella indigofera]
MLLPMKISLPEPFLTPSRALLLALAYFATGWLGLLLPNVGAHITLIWLPTGISVAALLGWGKYTWPGIYLGALLTNLSIGSPPALAATIAIGNTLGPLLVATLLTRTGFRPAFERQRDVGLFVAAAGLGMLLPASGGVASLVAAEQLPLAGAAFAWLTWWMGDTVGVLLAAPLVLSLIRGNWQSQQRSPVELLLWGSAACAIAWLAFIYHFSQLGGTLPLAFITLPMLAWAAVRFGIVGATVAGLGFSVTAAWGAANGSGAFAQADIHVGLTLLWCYMATTVITGLLITALQAERMQMEASLRASEEKLRGLYELSPLGIALTDSHGRFIEFNEAFRAICGYSEAELKALDYWELTPKRYQADEARQLAMLEQTGRYGPYEKEYRRKDGSLVTLELNGMTILGADGQHYIWSLVEDITERKRNQQQMEYLLAEQKAILDNDLIGIATAREQTIVWANPAMENILGYEPGELAGVPYRRHFVSDDAYENFNAEAAAILDAGGIYRTQVERVRKDGTSVWVDLSGTALRLETGESLWASVDITERVRLEHSMAQSEERMVLALAGADLGLWDLDVPSGRFTHNPRLAEMLGYRPGELPASAKGMRSLLHPDDATKYQEALSAHLRGKSSSVDIEFRLRHKEGPWIWVLSRGKIVGWDHNLQPLRMTGTHLDITARKDNEATLHKIASRVPGVVYQYLLRSDGSSCFPYASEAIRGIFRVGPEEVRDDDSVLEAIIHPDDVDALRAAIFTSAHDLSPWRHEYRLKFSDGSIRWLYGNSVPQREPDGSVLWHGFITDITDSKRADDELRIAAAAFESQEGMAVTDANDKILRVNQAFTRISGYSSSDVLGQAPQLLHADPDFTRLAFIRECTQRDGQWRGELLYQRKNGDCYPVLTAISAVHGQKGNVTHYVHTFIDITERKEAEELIRQLAFYDPLTGLPNRRLLLDRLQQALPASAHSKQHAALLFLDLDKFKLLNDTQGHDKGDLLLQQVATRLLDCVRKNDTVSRLGGDEFVLILEALDEEYANATAQAECVARKVLAALSQPFVLETLTWHCSASIGITLFHGEEETAQTLLKQADLAVYQAKNDGRNMQRLYIPEMQATLIKSS